ncbi:MAG: SMI1/KNR4 family protein [Planctomycetes bacterium]|nr:SMI1/KNR4 family protein [Planctomycetota bacterium]
MSDRRLREVAGPRRCPTNVTDVFMRLESQMSRLGHRAPTLLRPGLAPADLRRVVPVSLPREVVNLYSLHDGTTTAGQKLGDLWIIPLCYFMPLEKAVQEYHGLVRDVDWRPTLFPMFRDGAGTYYACETGDQAQSPIHRVSLQDAESDVQFDSLHSMLLTFLRAYEGGLVSVRPDTGVSMNVSGFFRLARSLNPSSAYWRRMASESPEEDGDSGP